MSDILLEQIADLSDNVQKQLEQIQELKIKLKICKDSQLRTYDGMAQKADKYDKAVEAIKGEIKILTEAGFKGSAFGLKMALKELGETEKL